MRRKEEVTVTATSAKMACNDATTLLLVSGPSDTQHGSLTLINKTNNDNDNNNNKKKNRTQEPISIIRNDNEKAEAPASFDCCEMILGELVGTGAFCEVHDLHDVRLLRRRSKTCSKHHQVEEKKGEEETNIEEQQQQQQKHRSREYIYQTCQDTKLGNSRYVVKHLRPNLLSERNHKVFNHASADCLREFEILSRLSHPNIVQLCGYNGGCIIANNNNNNNEEKKEEGNKIIINPEHFFIVLEKLEETLTQRIVRWIHINKRRSITDDDVSEQQQNNGEGDADADADSTISSISIEQQQQQLPPFYIEKLRYARDIANALTYIHSLGMVFRDLKPDNIGITVDGTVKLFDFGLCRELPTKPYNHKNCSAQRNEVDDHSTSSTRSSSNSSSSSSSSSNAFIKRRRYDPLYRMSSVGTRRYMSPEVISGYCYNQKTDVYSWSMVRSKIIINLSCLNTRMLYTV
jgi:serine/threonine protein kinase